jgi:hypothetical protein
MRIGLDRNYYFICTLKSSNFKVQHKSGIKHCVNQIINSRIVALVGLEPGTMIFFYL